MDDLTNKNKLKEGEWYSLKIVKHIEFEEEWYFVLETPFKTRITMLSEPYKSYSFKIGEEIQCKVDKVSCSGKIYLEPEHPFYKVDNTYSFEFMESKTIESLYGDTLDVLYFKDKLNNSIEIPSWKSFLAPEKYINLKVLRIKKAQLIAFPEDSPFITLYDDKQKLSLTFIEKFKNQTGDIVYLVVDQLGGLNIIPAKYFSLIEIPQNFKLNAIAVKHPTNNFFYIEPEHPKYKKGNTYPFVVKDIKVNRNTLNDNNIPEISLILKDDIFEEYKMVSFIENPPKLGDTMLLITLGIRKGVLQLQMSK